MDVVAHDLRIGGQQSRGMDATSGAILFVAPPLRRSRRHTVAVRGFLKEELHALGVTPCPVLDFLFQCSPACDAILTSKRMLHASQFGDGVAGKDISKAGESIRLARFNLLQPALGLLAKSVERCTG
jgi:hypothetical protein